MRALLLVAHGSRREESNHDVRRLKEVVAGFAGDRFRYVGCGFLEFAAPDVARGIDECVAAGAREIVVLPYFLSAGTHVTEHIPMLVEEARRRHGGVTITLAPHLGSAGAMAQALLELAEK